MAYPFKTYASIFDTTYGMGMGYSLPKGAFEHLVIRDSNTCNHDYLLIGCNDNESNDLQAAIRLNKKQVKQVIRATKSSAAGC